MANANQLILVLITCALFGLISQSSSGSAARQPETAKIRVFSPATSEGNCFMFCELYEITDGYLLGVVSPNPRKFRQALNSRPI